jgi:hypothetical protein
VIGSTKDVSGATFALPTKSKTMVFTCIALQIGATYLLVSHAHRSAILFILAFLVSGFVTDLVTGLAHFSFDYLWPPNAPVFGPIAQEFLDHHGDPTLDPSALTENFTRGAYGALPFVLGTWIIATVMVETPSSFFLAALLMGISLWGLAFHQIHSYTHMGSKLSPASFNKAVIRICGMPTAQRRKEFGELFALVGIPRWIRVLQRCRLFLRPEVHWQHHISFESDFSSVNGWSDPLMNLIYGPIARRKKANGARMPVLTLTDGPE